LFQAELLRRKLKEKPKLLPLQSNPTG